MRAVCWASRQCAAAATAPQQRAWVHAVSHVTAGIISSLKIELPVSAISSRQTRSLLSSLLKQKAAAPPKYPEQPFRYKLGRYEIADNYRWLAEYEAARPYLDQEGRYFKAASKHCAQAASLILQSLRQHVAATQVDDPPEQVGPYMYWNVSHPYGQDTVVRLHTSTGQQEVVLSADTMQQDAALLSKRLGMPVAGDHLGGLKLSQDHRLLAYSLEMGEGLEQYCCVARDVQSGDLLSSCVLPNVSSFEWSADGSCLYYCTADKHGRPCKVFRRMLGQALEDRLLFTEPDPKHFVTLTRTKDWRYVLINSHSKLSSEVHLIDARDAEAWPVCVHPRTPGMEYFVEHHHGHLLILTNCGSVSGTTAQQHQSDGSSNATEARGTNAAPAAAPAADSTASDSTAAAGTTPSATASGSHKDSDGSVGEYCLMSLNAAAAGTAAANAWQVLLPPRPHTAVTDMDVFDSCVVLHELQSARPGLRVLRLQPAQGLARGHGTGPQQQGPQQLQVLQERQVSMPPWVLALRPGINQDYYSSSLRLYASSPAVPEVPLELNLVTGQLQQPVTELQGQGSMQLTTEAKHPAGFNPSVNQCEIKQQLPLTCKRLWANSADGTQVPVTLLHAKDMRYTGQTPVLVEVYGAYGHVLTADFRPHRLALIERGWAVALAHVRGGGEGGRRWHAAGRQLNKPNSVADLLACLQLLIQLQVTSTGRMAAVAASAGGLTLAAAVNAAAHMFSAVVLEAPFVDWCAEMGDSGIEHALTEHEKDEWGDPSKQLAVAEMVRAMCPYNNLQGGVQYPAMLVTAGLQDTRVPYWMPVKYVAKLRSLQATPAAVAKGEGQHYHQPQSRPVLLQFEEEAGHFSIGHSAGSLEEIALQYAFLDVNRSG